MMCETCKYYRTMWWKYPCCICDWPNYAGYKECEEQDEEDRGDACEILEWKRNVRRVQPFLQGKIQDADAPEM